VDRWPRLQNLYLGILGAALYLCIATTQIEQVAYACLKFKLAVGSLMASAFLFFVPLALLAAVGPFLVRLLTPSVQSVGGSMGRLTAIGTLGSFGGTVLIGYVPIPLLPNSTTMIVTAGVLFCIAGSYLLIWGSTPAAKAATLIIIALGILCAWSTHPANCSNGLTSRKSIAATPILVFCRCSSPAAIRAVII
jgi:hypothetical protein